MKKAFIVSPNKCPCTAFFGGKHIHYVIRKIEMLRDIYLIVLKEIFIVFEVCSW